MRLALTKQPFVLFIGLIVVACVTINIYFPAEKVESAAEEIVRDIRGGQNRENPAPPPKVQGTVRPGRHWASLVIPATAWAQESATEVSNPAIRALKAEMRARYEQLIPFFRQGAIQEGSDGYLRIANTSSLGLREKRDLNALVEAENRDRRELYNAVAKALKIDSSEIDRVAEIFAGEWKKTAPPHP